MKSFPPGDTADGGLQPAFKTTATTMDLEPRQTLRACVSTVLTEYFEQVEDDMITDMYAMVLREVEAPLLAAVMRKARSNQCRAAHMLGLNRGTLRKKLKQYDLLE